MRDGHQSPRQHRTGADADLGAQNAGLRGEHQQQDDADEGDGDTGDGENLADPALVALRPRFGRRGDSRWRLVRAPSGA